MLINRTKKGHKITLKTREEPVRKRPALVTNIIIMYNGKQVLWAETYFRPQSGYKSYGWVGTATEYSLFSGKKKMMNSFKTYIKKELINAKAI